MKPAHEITGNNGRPLVERVPPARPIASGPRQPTAAEKLFFGPECQINPRTNRPVGELRPPTGDELKVFGLETFISPHTDRPVETGSGALIYRINGGGATS